MKIDHVIAGYIKLRDEVQRLDDIHKDNISGMKEKMSKLEAYLLDQANKQGVDSFKTEGGTAYKTTKESCTVTDRDAFFKCVKDNDLWELISAAANKVAVREYREEFGDNPPGVNTSVKYAMNVNRPRATTKKK